MDTQSLIPPLPLPSSGRGKLPMGSDEPRFNWRDWFTCGGCLSILIVLALAAIFGDDLMRLLAHH